MQILSVISSCLPVSCSNGLKLNITTPMALNEQVLLQLGATFNIDTLGITGQVSGINDNTFVNFNQFKAHLFVT